MSKIIASFFLLIVFTSCEKSINSGGIPIWSKYPIQLNREWEYNTTFKLEFYDSTGRIDSTEVIDLGNTICEITSLNDTMGNLINLVQFQEYDVLTPQNVHKMWYLNADSGLFAIAYSNPGSSQVILPKANIKNFDNIKYIINLIGLNPASHYNTNFTNQINDTSFYLYPRKVLQYPLRIGERWVELIEPFYRERFIKDKAQITINGNIYNCFKIESDWDWNIVFTDYINFTNGLIMRELLIDSVAIIGPEDPNPLGYYKFSSVSKLVRETKP